MSTEELIKSVINKKLINGEEYLVFLTLIQKAKDQQDRDAIAECLEILTRVSFSRNNER